VSTATALVLEAIRSATPEELAELRALLAAPQPDGDSPDYLLTVEETARWAKCSPETVRRACRSGQLRGARIGSQWRVSPQALAEWLAAPRTDNKRVERPSRRLPRSRSASRAVAALTEW
jgi:excisionase family DNA binding protein